MKKKYLKNIINKYLKMVVGTKNKAKTSSPLIRKFRPVSVRNYQKKKINLFSILQKTKKKKKKLKKQNYYKNLKKRKG